MGQRKHKVILDEQTREKLQKMQNAGVWPARMLKHARILLLADTSQGRICVDNPEIADKVGCSPNTVINVKRRYCEEDLESALSELPRPGHKRALNTVDEQKLIAIACTTPPDHNDHWTLKLLVKELRDRKIVDNISREAVRQVLLRHDLKPWQKKNVVHSKTRSRVRRENA